jgi:hypothetical protein
MEKKRNCKITINPEELITNRELFNSLPEEKSLPSKDHTKFNNKPFMYDMHLFYDADQETIEQDFFETMSLNVRYKRGKTEIVKPNMRYEVNVQERLASAIPPNWSQELDITAKLDARARGSQLNRMIIETCTLTGDSIQIPQLSRPGDISIDRHLRIEEMSKFMGISLKQATVLAKIYRILNIDFKTAVYIKFGKKKRQSLNMHIRDFVRNTRKAPWEIQITKTHKLIDYANEIIKLEATEQEDPEWATGPDFRIDTKYAFMANLTDGEEYTIKEQDQPDQYEQVNNINLYTYHKENRVPNAVEYLGNHGRRFLRLMEKADTLSSEALKIATTWVNKNKKEGIVGKEYTRMQYTRKSLWSKKLRELANKRAVMSNKTQSTKLRIAA